MVLETGIKLPRKGPRSHVDTAEEAADSRESLLGCPTLEKLLL
jgi:hypothetical protein